MRALAREATVSFSLLRLPFCCLSCIENLASVGFISCPPAFALSAPHSPRSLNQHRPHRSFCFCGFVFQMRKVRAILLSYCRCTEMTNWKLEPYHTRCYTLCIVKLFFNVISASPGNTSSHNLFCFYSVFTPCLPPLRAPFPPHSLLSYLLIGRTDGQLSNQQCRQTCLIAHLINHLTSSKDVRVSKASITQRERVMEALSKGLESAPESFVRGELLLILAKYCCSLIQGTVNFSAALCLECLGGHWNCIFTLVKFLIFLLIFKNLENKDMRVETESKTMWEHNPWPWMVFR